MKKKLRRKWLVIPMSIIFTTTLIIPSTSFAAKQTKNQQVHSPWEESKDLIFTKDKGNIEINNTNTLYNDNAIELFKDLEESSNQAKQDQNIVDKQFDNYQIQLNNTEINSLSNKATTQSTKSIYRGKFQLLALSMGTKTVNLPIAGDLLYHSLQNNPSDRDYQTNSKYAKDFSVTKSYQDISIKMANKIKKAKKAGLKGVGENGLSEIASAKTGGADWYLAINKYSYDWAAMDQGGGTWKIYIGIHDTYNFENIKNVNSTYLKPVQLVNNDAVKAQKAGAIVPYRVNIYREQTYKP